MNLFDGLHLYEIVLLILGSVLFLVLLVILIIFVIQRRSITALATVLDCICADDRLSCGKQSKVR
jgi:hypothetical protein